MQTHFITIYSRKRQHCWVFPKPTDIWVIEKQSGNAVYKNNIHKKDVPGDARSADHTARDTGEIF